MLSAHGDTYAIPGLDLVFFSLQQKLYLSICHYEILVAVVVVIISLPFPFGKLIKPTGREPAPLGPVIPIVYDAAIY